MFAFHCQPSSNSRSMKNARPRYVAILAFAIVAFAATELRAQRTDVALNEVGRRIMLNAPQPVYPAEARRKSVGGAGVYRLRLRVETGEVTRVDIVRSTGSKVLDDEAVRTLRQWRARPHTLRAISVPIRWWP
jgi:TonB family protein